MTTTPAPGPSGEFYGTPEIAAPSDPADDPLYTARMQPPDTQARRLDLATPRAVKLRPDRPAPWVLGDPEGRIGDTFRYDRDVAGWPIVHSVTIGAAQRLAQSRATAPPEPERTRGDAVPGASGHTRTADPDDRLFR